MKIAFITPNYPPETGACASRIQYTAQGLQKAGHSVEIFTFLPNYPKGKIFPKYRRKYWFSEVLDSINVWRYPVFPSASSRIIWRVLGMFSMSFSILGAFFRLKKTQPDIVFVQSPPLLLGFSGWLLARAVGAKFVLNLSDLWPGALVDLGAIRVSFGLHILEYFERFLYQKADLCVGQSEEIMTHLRQIIPAENTLLYRTGADCEMFFQMPILNHQTERPFRLVYAGLLGIAQGIFDLCKHMNFREINTELHIYGAGAEHKKLVRYLAENPHKNIFLHQVVSHQNVPQILQQYDGVLVVQKAKVYGTFPSKIYEAMAVGRPIIQSGEGEGAETVKKYKAGLVSNPKDYENLKKNLLMLKNLSLREQQKLGDNGRKTALRFFDRKIQLVYLEQKLREIRST